MTSGIPEPRMVKQFSVTLQMGNTVQMLNAFKEDNEWLTKGLDRDWSDEDAVYSKRGDNVNEFVQFTSEARPVICDTAQDNAQYKVGRVKTDWCKDLLNSEVVSKKRYIEAAKQASEAHLDRLIDIYNKPTYDKENAEIDKENSYYKSLVGDTNKRAETQYISNYHHHGVLGHIKNAIGRVGDKLSGLHHSHVDYDKVKQDLKIAHENRLGEIKSRYENMRLKNAHDITEGLAEYDDTGFAALVAEEAETLKELNQLHAAYEKNIFDVDKELAELMKSENKSLWHEIVHGVKHFAEHDIPVVNYVKKEIHNVKKVIQNPSGTNFRKLFLGTIGPVGDMAEASIEIADGESPVGTEAITLVKHVLKSFTSGDEDHGLEDLASYFVNTFGDETVENLRHRGLWQDHAHEQNVLGSDYQGITDLKVRSDVFHYDFWIETGLPETRAQDKFEVSHKEFLNYMDTSSFKNSEVAQNAYFAAGGSAFVNKLSAIFSHAYGKDFAKKIAGLSKLSTPVDENTVVKEMYKVIADHAYYLERMPYWVDSSVIGHRPAGFISTKEHSMIVLNKDLVAPGSPDIPKFYFEELGHLLNWWRCKLFEVDLSHCDVSGDGGARFRDAVLLDEQELTRPYPLVVADLPQHQHVDKNTIQFADGTVATLEGWPDYYKANDRVPSNSSVSWLFRLGVDHKSESAQWLSDELDLEMSVTFPKGKKRGNPWETGGSSGEDYCENDIDQDCNMPTMWINFTIRDAIKVSVTKIGSSLKTVNDWGFDISPRLVRKHTIKLPFQLRDVHSTKWKYMSNYNIYSKRFTVAAVSKIDAFALVRGGLGKAKPKVYKPEFDLKPAISGSFVVDLATKHHKSLEKYLALDFSSLIGGCAVGVIGAAILEQDAITGCHIGSDLGEALETGLQADLAHKPTVAVELDSNVIAGGPEFKYAKPSKPEPGVPSEPEDPAVYISQPYVPPSQRPEFQLEEPGGYTETHVSKFKQKAGKAFKSIGLGNEPIGVFRMQWGFDLKNKVLHHGADDLPTAIAED